MSKINLTSTSNPNPTDENPVLACKIDLIAKRVSEAFDADGIDDIRVPNKVSIWWVVLNIASVGKLISDIINIVKNECKDLVTNEDTLPEAPVTTNA